MSEILGGLISGGGSLVGGAIDAISANKVSKRNIKFQKQFAQQGIRWRVADAQAAGVHPLYALGAQLPSFSPVYPTSSFGSAISEAGQNIGRAVMAQATREERALAQMQMQLVASQIGMNDAQRMLFESEAARTRQEMWQATNFPNDTVETFPIPLEDVMSGSVAPTGAVKYTPSEVQSTNPADTSLIAGPGTPMWKRFELRPGVSIVLPGGINGDAAEVLESLGESPLIMAAVVAENNRRFGAGHWSRVFETESNEDPWWRKPGAYVGMKLADAMDWLRMKKKRFNQIMLEKGRRGWEYPLR